MRVIIEPNYDVVSQWAANYVAKRIRRCRSKMWSPLIWMNM